MKWLELSKVWKIYLFCGIFLFLAGIFEILIGGLQLYLSTLPDHNPTFALAHYLSFGNACWMFPVSFVMCLMAWVTRQHALAEAEVLAEIEDGYEPDAD